MGLRVTLIQGGGAGFDQVPAVQRILQAAGADIEWDEYLARFAAVEQGQPPLPEAMLRRVRETGLTPNGSTTTCSSAGRWACSPRSGR